MHDPSSRCPGCQDRLPEQWVSWTREKGIKVEDPPRTAAGSAERP